MTQTEALKSSKTRAKVIGALFIAATVTAIVSIAFVESANHPDYLNEVSANESLVAIGAVIWLLLAVEVVAISVLFFPILKQHKESVAVGYLAARIIEGVLIIGAAVSLLSLLKLSQNYVESGAASGSDYQATGFSLQADQELYMLMGTVIVFGASALILNSSLYQTRLVPRWLSIWGLIGSVLALIAGTLQIFGESANSVTSVVLVVVIAVQEMVFAVWLIVKGFSPVANAVEPTTQE
jgi:hypothetical protein